MMRDGASQQRRSQFVVTRAESIPEFLYPHAHIHLGHSCGKLNARLRSANAPPWQQSPRERNSSYRLTVDSVHRMIHDCLRVLKPLKRTSLVTQCDLEHRSAFCLKLTQEPQLFALVALVL